MAQPGGKKSKVTVWLVAVAVIGVTLSLAFQLLQARARPKVDWSAVLEAVGRQQTVHGQSVIVWRDGSVWQYSVWSQVLGPGDCVTKGALVRVRPSAAGAAMPSQPDPQLVALCNAMDFCGKQGIVTHMAAARLRTSGQGREWAGKPSWECEVRSGEALPGAGRESYPAAWGFVIDPKTKLVRSIQLLAIEEGETRALAQCSYEYNRPLPPGFGQAPPQR